MKSIFKFSLLLIYIPLIYFLTGLIFKGNHIWISLILIFILVNTFYFFYRKANSFIYGFCLLVLPFIMFLLVISYYAGYLRTISYIIFIPISSVLGYSIRNKNFIYSIITGILLSFFVAFIFIPNQRNYFVNLDSKRDTIFPQISLVDEKNMAIEMPNDKIIVLDFWNTSCGVCFKKFPEFEKLYLNFKDNPDVQFYSVNVPLKRDSFEDTIELVNRLGYKYQTIYATLPEDIERKLKIESYPKFIIVKNNRIRFSGYLDISNNVFVYNTENELKKLIKE